ncbi:MAG: alpha/beta hydrolase [Bacteroidaceae bacterium]|nr:alpha/beta hydrolase [Bacteroidaceae bacterium]
MKRILLLLACIVSLMARAQYYQPDVLGNGFEQHTFVMPDDYHGRVVSTLVRKMAPDTVHSAVLYVHGYNDYFFQEDMANRFIDWGYNFYAIDLRKYGRSLLPGQREYEVRDMSEYYADIDSALSVIRREGNDRVVLMGHSTGGLTTTLYCHAHRDNMPVDALILNSPFFEWNFNALFRNVLIPTVAFIGQFFPDGGLPDATKFSPYAMSLLKAYHGEWEFNTEWKRSMARGERFGWIRAIDKGHDIIHSMTGLPCPVLLMHSDKTITDPEWTPDYQRGDAVLNVEHIARYGTKIGDDVTEVTIVDGLHDLILSRPDVREQAYRAIYDWLSTQQLLKQ